MEAQKLKQGGNKMSDPRIQVKGGLLNTEEEKAVINASKNQESYKIDLDKFNQIERCKF